MINRKHPVTTAINLYRTGDHACSYLPGKQCRTLFVDPDLNYDSLLYEELTQYGFRRSGQHLYRPDCKNCHACVSVRVAVDDFILKRRFRRVLAKNQTVEHQLEPATFREEDYQLFARYIAARHGDGDMYPATEASYADFLATGGQFSFHIRYFLDGDLIGLAVTDMLPSGLSAIYTFYEPNLEKRSLGVFSILTQISLSQAKGLPYLYLGYWVPGCEKMRYKTQYQPIEYLARGEWSAKQKL